MKIWKRTSLKITESEVITQDEKYNFVADTSAQFQGSGILDIEAFDSDEEGVSRFKNSEDVDSDLENIKKFFVSEE